MKTNRRQFIINAGKGALALSSLPFLMKCAGLTRGDADPCGKREAGELTPAERNILCLATLAPSGHNAQPWTVRREAPGRFIIGSARERWLPAVDPENRETLLSIGAFIENFTIASGHQSLRADIRITARSSFDAEIARVVLSPSSPASDDPDRLRLRRTVKKGYMDRELSVSDADRLEALSPERVFYIPRTNPRSGFLAEGTIDANRIQAWRDPAQEELSRWIRWRDADARRHMNGITPEGMEISGISGWFVRRFFDQSSVMEESFRKITVELVREQAGTCAGWIIITSPDSRPATLLETGRLFQRLFLSVREMNIALHPMTQMLEETQWKDRVAPELGLPGTVQFILRAGYLRSYPGPVSLRMPLDRIMV